MKGRRVSVDLSPAAAAEIDRLRALTGMKAADLFRHSMSLLRLYIEAKIDGRELRIINPSDPADQVRLEFPISVPTTSEIPAKNES